MRSTVSHSHIVYFETDGTLAPFKMWFYASLRTQKRLKRIIVYKLLFFVGIMKIKKISEFYRLYLTDY